MHRILMLLWLLLANDAGETDASTEDEAADTTDDQNGEGESGEGDQRDGEEQGNAEDEIRDQRIKALSSEAAKYRRKLRDAEARIKELEQGGEQVRTIRLENAFLRTCWNHRERIDVEAALDLATVRGFFDGVRDEDGEGMEDAVEKLLLRYPWLLIEGDGASDADALPSTRNPKPPGLGKPAADRSALKKRFPALRSR